MPFKKAKVIKANPRRAAGKPRTYTKEEFDQLEAKAARANRYSNLSGEELGPFAETLAQGVLRNFDSVIGSPVLLVHPAKAYFAS